MPNTRTNPNFMNGVPELLLLKLLAEQEMYGYEVVQAIRHRTADIVTLGEGVIYPVLHSLEREGALSSRRQTVNGRSRIYYSITPLGQRRLSDLTGSWIRLVAAIQDVVRGEKHVPAV
ncbi:PadR family transcriptional regulator [Brucella sp. IR073]|uniref:PadR family transcriptional regulator n=1 Tax=unclassified Brucella TaxID=2632610 RepID=UPI003B987BEB